MLEPNLSREEDDSRTEFLNTPTAFERWDNHRIGYETAWRMMHGVTRVPGFRVQPSNALRNTVTHGEDEINTVTLAYPPRHDVTVNVSANLAGVTVSPASLVFTPENYDQAQTVTVSAAPGLTVGDGFAVSYDTSSSDMVFAGLHDEWAYHIDRLWVVTFDVGEHGEYAGGGALVQKISKGDRAEVPVLTPDAGYVFMRWDTAFNDIQKDITVRALYETADSGAYYGGNLLVNGGGELPPLENGWHATGEGTWTRSTGAIVDTAYKGNYYIYVTTVDEVDVEAYQDVDLSDYADAISTGQQTFTFTGYLACHNDKPSITISFLDASGEVLGVPYIKGGHDQIPRREWTLFKLTDMTAPRGTTHVRVYLQSDTKISNNTGFDDLRLVANELPMLHLLSGSDKIIGGSTFDMGPTIQGSVKDLELTILNASSELDVNLDGNLLVNLIGDSAFTVVSQPAKTELAPGETTTFTIRYTAHFGELKKQNAQLIIANTFPYSTFVINLKAENPGATKDLVLNPIHDGDTFENLPDTAYGFNHQMEIKGNFTGSSAKSLMKFDLTDVADRPYRATLRLYKASGDNNVPVSIRSVEDDNWTENTLTWNNAPAAGDTLATISMEALGWYEVDITSAVQNEFSGDKLLSLALEDLEKLDRSLAIRTRQGEFSPELVLRVPTAGTHNGAPTAYAGENYAVLADSNGSKSVTLIGSGSVDSGRTIASYVWSEGGSQITTGSNATVTLGLGEHTITLTVTDNTGETGSDTITVDVLESAPVAYGRNLLINGGGELGDPLEIGWHAVEGTWYQSSGSYMGNHSIAGSAPQKPSDLEAYQDVDISGFADSIDTGEQTFTFTGYVLTGNDTPTFEMLFLDASENVLEKKVLTLIRDDDAPWRPFSLTEVAPVGTTHIRVRLSSEAAGSNTQNYDEMKLVANEIINTAPVAEAGIDQVFKNVVGSQSVTLDGSGSSDADNDPIEYAWHEGDDPLGDDAILTHNFAVGIHEITLTVTDNEGLTGTDTVTVTVKEPVTYGSNLLINGGGELGDPLEIGWHAVEGTWSRSSGSYMGNHSIAGYAPQNPSDLEAYQDVDVSDYADSIDTGEQSFTFTGYVLTGNDTPTFEMLFLDASENVLEKEVLTLIRDDAAPWRPFSLTEVAPVGTTHIRVRLSSEAAGSNSQNYDEMKLVANEFDILNLLSGDDPISYGSTFDMGPTIQGSAKDLELTIVNGSPELDMDLNGNPLVSLSGSSAFTVVSQPAQTQLAPGETTTFTIRYTAPLGAKEVHTTQLSIGNSFLLSVFRINLQAENPAEITNVAPTADAGADQTVTDTDDNGSESIALNGAASSDSDGTIASYVWKEGATQIGTGVGPAAVLAVGTHTITLTVTDDEGATGSDTVMVTVTPPNTPPVVDAGPDQSVAPNGFGPWTPADTTPQAWFDASDTTTLWGDVAGTTPATTSVGKWDDKSGNNNHVIQGTGVNQPTTGIRTIGGLNALDFDGVSDYIYRATGIGSDINSLFIVMQADIVINEAPAPKYVIGTYGGEITTGMSLGSSTGAFTDEVISVLDEDVPNKYVDRQGISKNNLPSISTDAHIYSNVLSTDWFMGFDGSLASLQDLTSGTRHSLLFSQSLAIGASTRRIPADFHVDGTFAEIICVSSALSLSDRQKMEGYLAWKWELEGSLPVGHPYKSAAPTTGGTVVNLDGTVTDPEQTPTTAWTLVDGPVGATVSFGDVATVDTTATFTEAGVYTLRLTADDGIDSTSHDVVITVSEGSAVVDTDGDGISDDWETLHFGDLTTAGGLPGDDQDGDGFSDLNEYLAGTAPTNSASLLVVSDVAPSVTSGEYVITWQAVATRRYSVLKKTNLLDPSWTTNASGIQGIEPLCTHTVRTTTVKAFYSIAVEE